MKIGFSPDYYVQVFPDGWEEDPADAELWDGIVTVLLNTVLRVRFVPDVSASGPPWRATIPAAQAQLDTVDGVREYAVVTSRYVVTPNERQAGRVEQIREPERLRLVFYVTHDEFTTFAAELADLAEIASDAVPELRRGELLDRAVVRFLDERVLGDPRVLEERGDAVGRAPA